MKTYILQFARGMDGQLTMGKVKYKLTSHQFPYSKCLTHILVELLESFLSPLITCFHLLLSKGTHKDSLHRLADMQPIYPTVTYFSALTYTCHMLSQMLKTSICFKMNLNTNA